MSTTGRWRALTIALWVVQVGLALYFVSAAVPKLAGVAGTVPMFDRIGAGQWLRYLAGTLELAGAVGLLVPRLRAAAALGLAVMMALATTTQAAILHNGLLTPAVPGVVCVLVAWARRAELRALVTRLRGASARGLRSTP